MGQEQIYREESIKRVQSPEQLNDYLRVTSPSVWMALTAVVVILIGTLIWSGVGWLESAIDCEALAENGEIVVSLPDSQTTVQAGMPLRIGGAETLIEAMRYDETGNIRAVARVDIPDGIWPARIITERIHPLRFLFN